MSLYPLHKKCPICLKERLAGVIDMEGQENKYICPLCKGRHYGEPEIDERGSYICARCNEETPINSWKIIPMSKSEPVKGDIEACDTCWAEIEKGKIAIVEIEDGTTGEEGRTGKVWFTDPPELIKESIGDAKLVYAEASVIEKYKNPEQ